MLIDDATIIIQKTLVLVRTCPVCKKVYITYTDDNAFGVCSTCRVKGLRVYEQLLDQTDFTEWNKWSPMSKFYFCNYSLFRMHIR
jgi:hypothetical protein